MNAVRQSETVKKQQATVRGTATDDMIDAVHKAKLHQKLKKATHHRCDQTQGNQHIKQHSFSPTHIASTSKNSCSHYGRSPKHPKHQCPAREATCHLCSKKGHFKSMCRTKKVIDDISDEEEFVVHTEIAVVEGGTKLCTIDIQLGLSLMCRHNFENNPRCCSVHHRQM